MAIKSLSIRIDEELLHKLHIVADYGPQRQQRDPDPYPERRGGVRT